MKRRFSILFGALVALSLCAYFVQRAYAQCTVTVPGIVYSHAWTGQTASIGQYTMFTPSANGLFRVTFGGIATGTATSNNNMDVIAYVQWATAVSNDYYVCTTSASTYETIHTGLICTFEGESGVPIQFWANLSQNGTGGTLTGYDEYVTVEQLQ